MRAISTRLFMTLAGVALAAGGVSAATAPAQAGPVSTLGSCSTGQSVLTGWSVCTGYAAHRVWVECYDENGPYGWVTGPWVPSDQRSTGFCGLGYRSHTVFAETQDLPAP